MKREITIEIEPLDISNSLEGKPVGIFSVYNNEFVIGKLCDISDNPVTGEPSAIIEFENGWHVDRYDIKDVYQISRKHF